jgi:hypothetical protein
MGLGAGSLPFFVNGVDGLSQPPPAHMGIPPYHHLDPTKSVHGKKRTLEYNPSHLTAELQNPPNSFISNVTLQRDGTFPDFCGLTCCLRTSKCNLVNFSYMIYMFSNLTQPDLTSFEQIEMYSMYLLIKIYQMMLNLIRLG